MPSRPDSWVIDGDGHVMEPKDLWTRRMDRARLGDWIPHTEALEPYYEVTYAGGEVRSGGRELQDRICAQVGLSARKLRLLPSEYFRRQCYAGFECEEWNLAACAKFLGPERILWATDYPHPEYHAGVMHELYESLEPLDAAARRRVLGQNAIEAYRLPLDPAAPPRKAA